MHDLIERLIRCTEGARSDPSASGHTRYEWAEMQAAATIILNWLAGRRSQQRAWIVRLDGKPEMLALVSKLLAGFAGMGEFFEINDERLDFRPSVSQAVRAALENDAWENYRPVVER